MSKHTTKQDTDVSDDIRHEVLWQEGQKEFKLGYYKRACHLMESALIYKKDAERRAEYNECCRIRDVFFASDLGRYF